MAPPATREELMEELTIQGVILESLEGEEFDGAEESRREAKAEIAKIKRELKSRRNTAETRLEGESSLKTTHSPQAASQPSQWSESSSRTPVASPAKRAMAPSINLPMASNTPGSYLTPQKVRASPSFGSLPSRKRDFGSSSMHHADEPNKSRRTTPTPIKHANGAAQAAPSPWQQADIIDLTGPDVDEDSTYIAEQVRQEKRHAQERKDRDMAMFLSNQDLERQSLGSSSTPAGHNSNAFSKIMSSQLSNARTAFGSDDDDSSIELNEKYPVGVQRSVKPESLDQQTGFPRFGNEMSGFAPVNREGMSNMGLHNQNPLRTPVYGPPGGPGVQRYPAWTPGSAFPVGGPTYPHHPHHLPGRSNHGISPALLIPGMGAPRFPSGSSPMPGIYPASALPNQGGLDLSRIINRTNMFDYTNGMDAFGNVLPDRLAHFLQDSFHDPRVTEQELDDLLQNIRPDMDIPEKNREGTPAGLKTALYPHQELALTWMKQMEEGTNKGGILADDMGLGKTISTLALMLARPATCRPKTNLIIGPLSLVRQWEEEIQKRTKLSHRMSVFVHHNKKSTIDELLKYDVVLTTYGTLAQELRRLDKFYEENAGRNMDFNDKSVGVKFPLLHPSKAKFHRIILDEAQCIKNRITKTAKACHKLNATYRWCLTGTPMMNGVLELYSLLKFLRIKPYHDWEKFRQAFGTLFGTKGDSKSVAMTRLRALLKASMLRRKKDSMLDGKPIVRLPGKSEEIIYAELSNDEKDFYKQLEEKSQVQFNKYLREGSVGKNYSSILVLLLRLRQACCHPHLNLDVDDGVTITSESMSELVKTLDPAIVNRIKEIEAFECPICYDAVQTPTFFIPCGHDSCGQCLTRLVDNAATANLQAGDESDRAKCPVCRSLFDPKKCFTYDAFRRVHMPDTIEESGSAAENSENDSSDDEEDSESEDEYDDDVDKQGNLKGFVVEDGDLDDGDVKQDGETTDRKKKKKKGKGKMKKSEVKPSMLKSLRKEAIKNKAAYKKYMSYLRKTWLPAAKVSKCMELLKTIGETGEKTIIFSQWTLLLDLLEVAMWHDGFQYKPRRYDGSMTSEQRFDAARDFRDKKDVQVMLVSLRAGNAGLNLTSASRVIIMDPFWNPYIEMQAVDRAYRIGQTREVKVYRILTKDTVEDRIVDLQNRKKEMVEAALNEAEMVKIGRLGASELRFLFNGRN